MEQSNTSPAPEFPSPSWGSVLTAAALGVAIAALCFIPPPHLAWGLFGPLIGGCVAGNRVRAGGATALQVGVVFGGLLSVVVMAVASFIILLLPVGDRGAREVLLAGGVAAVYGSIFGTVGAYFGGRRARRPRDEEEESARPL